MNISFYPLINGRLGGRGPTGALCQNGQINSKKFQFPATLGINIKEILIFYTSLPYMAKFL
jgi:hypothetical protein